MSDGPRSRGRSASLPQARKKSTESEVGDDGDGDGEITASSRTKTMGLSMFGSFRRKKDKKAAADARPRAATDDDGGLARAATLKMPKLKLKLSAQASDGVDGASDSPISAKDRTFTMGRSMFSSFRTGGKAKDTKPKPAAVTTSGIGSSGRRTDGGDDDGAMVRTMTLGGGKAPKILERSEEFEHGRMFAKLPGERNARLRYVVFTKKTAKLAVFESIDKALLERSWTAASSPARGASASRRWRSARTTASSTRSARTRRTCASTG